MSPLNVPSLSDRGLENVSKNGHWRELRKVLAYVYDRYERPDGKINLGMAENSLMHDDLLAHIQSHFRVDPSTHLTYGSGPNGSPTLTKALAGFFNSKFKALVPVYEKEFVITSGVTSLIDSLTWCLCNDGEGILIPKPLYGSFVVDIEMRSRGRLLPVSFLRDGDEYSVDRVFEPKANRDAFESALEKYTREGIKVRAVIISNPHNPLGRCYPPETLQEIGRFCQRHGLHLISDEIYAMSTFANPSFPNAQLFNSVLSIHMENILDPSQLHVLYGMSKDFCANGMRVGVLHTRNAALHEAVSSINVFAWPSYTAQDIWARILMDTDFLDGFIKKNQDRLAKSYSKFVAFLDQHSIPYLKGGNAGFFLWVHLVQGGAGEGSEKSVSMKVLKKQLLEACLTNGVFIRDGGTYFAEEREDGWFRITFTVDEHILEIASERLISSLQEMKLLTADI